MGIIKHIKNSPFWIRLTHWEYWPFGVLYIPVYFYWFWLCLRARSFFFFSASNPGIENGGFLGESKSDILKIVPAELVPKSLLIRVPADNDLLMRSIRDHGFDFPLIVKPDIGERGWLVERIHSMEDLLTYAAGMNVNFLIQDYVDDPVELGIFYYKYPNEPSGVISSVVIKETLKVSGDGISTIGNLVNEYPRAKLVKEKLHETLGEHWNDIPGAGETVELEPIGNHCRGTTFLDGNHLINSKLTSVFDDISSKVEGFYFGRFDVKCKSIEELYEGKLVILELNGAGSEPAHIYHPGASIFNAYKVIFYHLRQLLNISRLNKSLGVRYLSFGEGLRAIRKLRRYKSQAAG